jgi:hypothetical protein
VPAEADLADNTKITEAAPADPVAWPLSGTVALRFPASRSQAYDAAVATARAADHYAETMIGKTLVHWCGFGHTREQLARALSVVHATHGIKGFELYAGGQMVADWYRAEAVLRCATQASASPDPRAHCVVMVSRAFIGARRFSEPRHSGPSNLLPVNPSPSMEDLNDILAGRSPGDTLPTYPFPCRLLLDRQFRFQPEHPSSDADQLLAGAVRYGCDWCPNLRR